MTDLIQEAQSPETTNERLLEIAEEASDDIETLLEIFRNPNCEDFEEILEVLDEDVRKELAESWTEDDPVQLLESLVELSEVDTDDEIRIAILENQLTPLNILELLIEDLEFVGCDFFYDVIEHPNCSEELGDRVEMGLIDVFDDGTRLEMLSEGTGSGGFTFKYILESNITHDEPISSGDLAIFFADPNIIPSRIDVLIDGLECGDICLDETSDILAAVASNPSTSENLLARIIDFFYNKEIELQTEEILELSIEIIGNPNSSEQLLDKIIDFLSKNEPELLDELDLEKEDLESIAISLGEHKDVSIDCLEKLFLSALKFGMAQSLILAISTNPNASEALLKTIWFDSSEYGDPVAIRETILKHPNWPTALDSLSTELNIIDLYPTVSTDLITEAQATTNSPERLRELAEEPALAFYLAANPATPGDLLRHWATTGMKSIRKRCALNPNTPKETLRELAKYFPEEFIQNPVFNLLWVEDPQLLTNLSEDGLTRLLANPDLELDIMHALAQHENPEIAIAAKCHVQSTLAIDETWETTLLQKRLNSNTLFDVYTEILPNPSCPIELLQQLASDERDYVREDVAKHPKCPPELFQQLATDHRSLIRRYVAGNLNSPTELLQQLATDEDEWVRKDTVQNPNCPLQALRQLANDNESHVRWCVAGNANCPGELLQQLVHNEDKWEMKKAVLEHPNCPVETLQKFATDSDENVRWLVARNPNCPVELLQQLAVDEDEDIRKEVARNPNCPIKTLEQLATDEDKYVRKAVAGNPNCPIETLQQLASDEGQSALKEDIAENPNSPTKLLQQLAVDEDKDIREAVARNPNCPIKTLEQLATDEDKYVRKAVARNPNCPIETLQQLTYDETQSALKEDIAKNPSCSVELLHYFSIDNSSFVRRAVAKNPNCSVELLQKLASDEDEDVRKVCCEVAQQPDYPIEKQQAILQGTLTFFASGNLPSDRRLFALRSPHCPTEPLMRCATSLDFLERRAVAQNPNTPAEVLQTMVATDADRVVRQHAQANLDSRNS